jgi:hypothetical protein
MGGTLTGLTRPRLRIMEREATDLPLNRRLSRAPAIGSLDTLPTHRSAVSSMRVPELHASRSGNTMRIERTCLIESRFYRPVVVLGCADTIGDDVF